MRDQKQEKVFFVITVLVLFAAAGVLLPAGVFHWFTTHAEVNEFLRHLAVTFALAGILALSVDSYLKKRFASEVVKEVAPFIFGVGMPRELVDEVMYSRDIRLVRRDMLIEFILRDHSPGLLEFETIMSFVLEHFGDEETTFPHRLGNMSDKYAHIKPCAVLFAEASGEDLLDGGYSYTGDEVPVTRGKDGAAVWFEKPVRIRPNRGMPRNQFAGRTFTLAGEADQDVFLFPHPIVNMKVRILSKPADLEVNIVIGHRKHASVQRSPELNPTQWELRAAFPHWSAVTVSWKRKSEASLPPKPIGQKTEALPGVSESALTEPRGLHDLGVPIHQTSRGGDSPSL